MKLTLVFLVMNAWAAEGAANDCILQCNDRRFKVAAAARRKECIKTCLLKDSTKKIPAANSLSVYTKDTACVNSCNRAKILPRKKADCFAQCPDATKKEKSNTDVGIHLEARVSRHN